MNQSTLRTATKETFCTLSQFPWLGISYFHVFKKKTAGGGERLIDLWDVICTSAPHFECTLVHEPFGSRTLISSNAVRSRALPLIRGSTLCAWMHIVPPCGCSYALCRTRIFKQHIGQPWSGLCFSSGTHERQTETEKLKTVLSCRGKFPLLFQKINLFEVVCPLNFHVQFLSGVF